MAPRTPSNAAGTTEKKRRWYHNIADAFRLVAKAEPWFPWVLLGVVVVMIALGAFIGSLVGQTIYVAILGFLLSFIVCLLLLTWRVRKVSYAQIEDQRGASIAVLDQIKRGWNIEQEPVAVNARTQDLVFRMVGRPGIVLISEGPASRVARMLRDEQRKVNRVAPKVAVHLVQTGREDGQVPLPKLQSHVRSLPNSLNAAEVAAVANRLRSLGTMNLPIPKGIDPTRARPDRKGMRGR